MLFKISDITGGSGIRGEYINIDTKKLIELMCQPNMDRLTTIIKNIIVIDEGWTYTVDLLKLLEAVYIKLYGVAIRTSAKKVQTDINRMLTNQGFGKKRIRVSRFNRIQCWAGFSINTEYLKSIGISCKDIGCSHTSD